MPFQWETDVENVNDVSEVKLDLLLAQAEKRLQSTVDSHDHLHMRAGVLLTFVIAFTVWLTDNQSNAALLTYLPFAFASCVLALMVIIPRKIDVVGYCPDLLYTKKQTGKTDKEFKEIFIRRYGIKTVDNIAITDRMGLYLNGGIIAFVSGIGVLLATTGLLSIWGFVSSCR